MAIEPLQLELDLDSKLTKQERDFEQFTRRYEKSIKGLFARVHDLQMGYIDMQNSLDRLRQQLMTLMLK